MDILPLSGMPETPVRRNNAAAPRICRPLMLFAAVCVVSGLLGAALVLLDRAQQERNAIEDRALAVARASAAAADREMAAAIARMEGLSTSPVLRAGDLRRFYDQLRTMPSPPGTWFVLRGPEGHLLNTLRPYGDPNLPRNADFAHPDLDGIRREIRERMARGEPYISPVVRGALAGVNVIGIQVPVRLDSGERLGLQTIVPGSFILAALQAQALPAGWNSAMIDGYGMLIAQARPPEALTSHPLPAAWTRALRDARSDGQFQARSLAGAPTLIAFARAPASGWVAVTEVPLAAVEAPFRDALIRIGILAAGLLLLAGVAAWLLGRRIERPIHALDDRARRADAEHRQARRDLDAIAQRLLTVQEEERRRIARDLHDTTLQDLATALMAAERIERSRDEDVRDAALGAARGLIERAMQDLRTLSYLLHPPLLKERGLAAALHAYVAGFAARGGMECDFNAEDTLPRLDAEVKIALFRVAQEALANAHRHSGARHATVTLRATADDVRLIVSDDGQGFAVPEDMDEAATLGVGIPGMRARLHQIGGWLTIQSDAGGTVVMAAVPRASQRHDAVADRVAHQLGD